MAQIIYDQRTRYPRSGIDTDARWGFSHTKQWMFGYKLHITSSTGSLIIPLSADFHYCNITNDNQRYSPSVTSHFQTKYNLLDRLI